MTYIGQNVPALLRKWITLAGMCRRRGRCPLKALLSFYNLEAYLSLKVYSIGIFAYLLMHSDLKALSKCIYINIFLLFINICHIIKRYCVKTFSNHLP